MPSPTPAEDHAIADAEHLLKAKDFEGARVAAEPVFSAYQRKNQPLTPRLIRLFGVFVAASNGDDEALKLLDQPLAASAP